MKISKLTKQEEKALMNEYHKAQKLLSEAKIGYASLVTWESYLLSMSELKAQNPSHFKTIIQGPLRQSLN